MSSWKSFESVPMVRLMALRVLGMAPAANDAPSSSWRLGQKSRGAAGVSIAAGSAFLLITGIGAATSYFKDFSGTIGSEDSDGKVLSRLGDYARSFETDEPAPLAQTGNLLPDVTTMIERLATRLQTSPEDIQGWRMLGWSYFNTGHYEQAAAAYARAIELDPSSAELKLSYEDAKAKAAEARSGDAAPSSQTEGLDKDKNEPSVEKTTTSDPMPPREHGPSIQSMVDGLAARLESSPRDAEGWARLMRSRVVLGERELAVMAFRKALDVFKDDAAASSKITATANELGLETE